MTLPTYSTSPPRDVLSALNGWYSTTTQSQVRVTFDIPAGTRLQSATYGGITHEYEVSSRYVRDLSFVIAPGSPITADMFNEMLEVLKEVIDHNHMQNDQYVYNNNCNCNCNCNCSRGTL
jgi:hypothetical protein